MTTTLDVNLEIARFYSELTEYLLQYYQIAECANSILDLGCGDQKLLAGARTHFPNSRLVGVDRREDRCFPADWAEDKEIELHYFDITRGLNRFGSKEFDIVSAQFLMPYLSDMSLSYLLAEIRRILKPNGIFVCQNLHADVDVLLSMMEGIVEINGEFLLPMPPGIGAYHCRGEDYYWNLVKRSGFRLEHREATALPFRIDLLDAMRAKPAGRGFACGMNYAEIVLARNE